MFNPAPKLFALRQSGKLAVAVRSSAVLLAYLCHMLKHGHAWPTVETLCQLTGLSRSHVLEQRRQLVEGGILVRIGGKGEPGREVPVFALGEFDPPKIKPPVKPGSFAPVGVRPAGPHPIDRPDPTRPAGRTQNVSGLKQEAVKQEQGAAAAVRSALIEAGIDPTKSTLTTLLNLSPPLTVAAVGQAVRVCKGKNRPVGAMVDWLKSDACIRWMTAQQRTAAAVTTAAAEKSTAAASRKREADRTAAAEKLIAAMTKAELRHEVARYIEQAPPFTQSRSSGMSPEAVAKTAGFIAHQAQKVK